jgi:two-component system nitrate/nitrite response regulator NarL
MVGSRILLVDDHPGFRAAASQLLRAEGCTVVGAVSSGEEAVTAVHDLAPEVVLVDLNLPGIDGAEVAMRLAGLLPRPAVILISSHEDAEAEPRVTAAPVRGFIAKRNLAWASIAAVLES